LDSSSPVPLEPFSVHHSIFLLINYTDSISLALLILSLIAGIIISGLIASSETALFSLNNFERKEIEKKSESSDAILVQLLERPKRLLGTILLSNLLTYIFIIGIGFKIYHLTVSNFIIQYQWLFILLLVGVILILKIILGEIAPKIYAVQNNLLVARKTAWLIRILFWVLRPFTELFLMSSTVLRNKFEVYNRGLLVEEIDQVLDQSHKNPQNQGLEERNLLKGVVKFGNIFVTQIMKARVDVVFINISSTFHELLETVRNSGYSRIPVCNGDLDQTEGIIYAKDLLYYLDADDEFNWHSLIKPALFVPESKKIDSLLEEFQTKRVHMAIVVDEYGGASGLVTLEDVLEEVIGEIKDEFDDIHEIDFRKLDAHNFLFEGKTSVNDMCKVLGIPTDTFKEERGEADTIAGMMLEIKGELPLQGDEIEINGYTFKVIEMNAIRIVKVKITIHEN
jgi:putative hemolysin